MLFNSLVFVVFSFIFFLGWAIVKNRTRSKWLYITVFSFIFYGWWDWRFVFLIIFSGLVDYFAGGLMRTSPRYKKAAFIVSIVVNLGSLSIFKYSSFFANTVDSIFRSIGIEAALINSIPEFALILPVGISFYTFQSMSYTIDIYRDRLTPVKNIFHFFAYLSMFPQLVAGPIIRAKDMLNQLAGYRPTSNLMIWHGAKLIIIGLFQKTVLADNIGPLVNYSFKRIDLFPSSYH